MPPPKRVKLALNLKQKCEILEKLKRNIPANVIAKEYGVANSTITYIRKQESEILKSTATTYQDVTKKNLKNSEYPEMEDKLYAWFLEQREHNCPINSTIMRAKAKQIFAKLYPEKEFSASNGWFENFKKRTGIRLLKICGEKLSADTAAIDPFIQSLKAKIQEMGLTEEQIYNADETALYYRLLPDITYVAASEKNAPGHKKSKERVTLMLCSNATGTHKINPLVIGKSAKPRAFKNFKNPLEYANSKSAWMTTYIFNKWFRESFVKQVRFSKRFFQCTIIKT